MEDFSPWKAVDTIAVSELEKYVKGRLLRRDYMNLAY